MKLMEIETDTLTIPETEYDARITMPSAEFARIVRDLNLLGESVRIEISKEGVRFAADGEAANGSVLLKPTDGAGVGKVTKQQVLEIAKTKMPDLNTINVDSAVRQVEGTARSMGLEVAG